MNGSHNIFKSYSEMVNDVRICLLDHAKQEIRCRWSAWKEIVERVTTNVHEQLFITQAEKHSFGHISFEYEPTALEIKTMLAFIEQWNGLQVEEQPNTPQAQREYKQKALSWFRGRRATQFGNFLYPVMVANSRTFAGHMQSLLVANVTGEYRGGGSRGKCAACYLNLLIVSYISELCTSTIQLTDGAKKIYLLCPRTLETKHCKTRSVLQQYARIEDIKYYELFPQHRYEATEYFTRNRDKWLREFNSAIMNLKGIPSDLLSSANLGSFNAAGMNYPNGYAETKSDCKQNDQVPTIEYLFEKLKSSVHRQHNDTIVLPAQTLNDIIQCVLQKEHELNLKIKQLHCTLMRLQQHHEPQQSAQEKGVS